MRKSTHLQVPPGQSFCPARIRRANHRAAGPGPVAEGPTVWTPCGHFRLIQALQPPSRPSLQGLAQFSRYPSQSLLETRGVPRGAPAVSPSCSPGLPARPGHGQRAWPRSGCVLETAGGGRERRRKAAVSNAPQGAALGAVAGLGSAWARSRPHRLVSAS